MRLDIYGGRIRVNLTMPYGLFRNEGNNGDPLTGYEQLDASTMRDLLINAPKSKGKEAFLDEMCRTYQTTNRQLEKAEQQGTSNPAQVNGVRNLRNLTQRIIQELS